ncbi:ankyrin repeat domain-containing protein [Roseomonas sp. OT10]|uniref:ankyrin repeat domain-containing protein n=1 Tax=Roseomonas cutis TaxID=2897332 RepID=UPI001E4C87E3|nr:ankyrin repeat domain-containing protein [Roseomonas sp. OT10]UFN50913.1 ankyrin repeat domain-containing protein [Roseomonas sp. OT10]
MRRILAALPVILLPLGAAQAQSDFTRPRGPLTPPQQNNASRPPPAALPGLANRPRNAPIEAEVPSATLSPNAALFDAINRGDLAAARDAMARGADLDARNALGLAPIDAAVDQGRNEIAFYLLSARGTVRSSAPPPDQAAAAPPPRNARGASSRPAPAPRSTARDARDTTVTRTRPPAELRAAERAPVGGGGAPRPEAGFLGFDGGRGG